MLSICILTLMQKYWKSHKKNTIRKTACKQTQNHPTTLANRNSTTE